MATSLGPDRNHSEDTISETVRRMRIEQNALIDFILLIVNAAVTNGYTFQSNVDGLVMTTIRRLFASRERPTPPQLPTPT